MESVAERAQGEILPADAIGSEAIGHGNLAVDPICSGNGTHFGAGGVNDA